MSEKPKSNSEKSNKFRNAILAVLAMGIGVGVSVANCSDDELVSMHNNKPDAAMIRKVDKERMSLSKCLIKQGTFMGAVGCLLGCDEEENESTEETPADPIEYPKKEKEQMSPSKPNFENDSEPMLG